MAPRLAIRRVLPEAGIETYFCFLHSALVGLLRFVIVWFVHAAHLQGYLAALSSGFYAALQINGLSVILTDKYLPCKYPRSWIPATKQYFASTFPTWAR